MADPDQRASGPNDAINESLAMKRMHPKNPLSRIRPWRSATFTLGIEVDHDRHDKVRHVWVYLYRRTRSHHGRLKAMHGIIPLGKRLDPADMSFRSPTYRLKTIRRATEVLLRAGVGDDQARAMMLRVIKVYPMPTMAALYAEKLSDPLVRLALGERRRGLSFFKTGKREWTREDDRLLNACLNDLERRWKMDKKVRDEFNRIVLGPRSRDHGV